MTLTLIPILCSTVLHFGQSRSNSYYFDMFKHCAIKPSVKKEEGCFSYCIPAVLRAGDLASTNATLAAICLVKTRNHCTRNCRQAKHQWPTKFSTDFCLQHPSQEQLPVSLFTISPKICGIRGASIIIYSSSSHRHLGHFSFSLNKERRNVCTSKKYVHASETY